MVKNEKLVNYIASINTEIENEYINKKYNIDISKRDYYFKFRDELIKASNEFRKIINQVNNFEEIPKEWQECIITVEKKLGWSGRKREEEYFYN